MNIVNFTPQSAFLGGIIIGLAVIIFFIGNGRLAGISGIVNDTLVSKQNRTDNFLFVVGLDLGPIFYTFLTKIKEGSHWPHKSRNPKTFSGLIMLETDKPTPKIIPLVRDIILDIIVLSNQLNCYYCCNHKNDRCCNRS